MRLTLPIGRCTQSEFVLDVVARCVLRGRRNDFMPFSSTWRLRGCDKCVFRGRYNEVVTCESWCGTFVVARAAFGQHLVLSLQQMVAFCEMHLCGHLSIVKYTGEVLLCDV